MAALSGYSAIDRLVHRLAFSAPGVQATAAEIEDRLFRRELEGVATQAPVFITSLPRAGTTVLLTALNAVPELASHLYRDMPFVMAPLLWSRVSERFRSKAMLQERAHGDGIAIGYDSPEAFEEVIWRRFWPEHFTAAGIETWSVEDADAEAEEFFRQHFRKIVALRCTNGAQPGRYLSKNNGNIARLDLLLHMFPDARIVVPVRSPLSHAASMHRQHLNFARRHARDEFARRYMDDIGHYEFGDLHRPIRFEGFAALAAGLTPADFDYWLAYWIAAFEHIARRRRRLHIIGYDAMCRHGREAGAELCAVLGIDPAWASRIGRHFRPVARHPGREAAASPLRERAEALYVRLVQA